MGSHNYWTSPRGMTRRSLIRGSAAAGIGLAGAALIGCGDDDDSPGTPAPGTPTGTATAAPTEAPGIGIEFQGGRLGRNMGALQDNFNVVTNAIQGDVNLSQHVYDRLISPRLDDRIYVLEAAESLELPDDVTVVAKLQEGLVYQDREPVNGRAVTADDVVAMQEYIVAEESTVFGAFQLDSLDYAEATDDRTVVFHLHRPNAYLFTGTQLGSSNDQCIVPREIVDGDFNLTEPVGSGPYQLRDYQFGSSYTYERNPTFRRASEGMPYIDERVMLPIVDASALEAAFRSEQIQVWIPPAETADRLIEDLGDRLTVVEELGLGIFTRNMSSARETFDDIRVREAWYRAFNTDEYIDLVANGWAVSVPGQVSAALQRYQLDESETEEYKRFDPETARQLLDAAGFNFDEVYKITTISSPLNDPAIQVHQQQLSRVGIETSLESLPAGDWIANVTTTGNYDFCLVNHPAYDSPQTPLRLNHTESRNANAWMNIRDPEIDAMIEESERELDPDGQVELVKELQRELLRRYAHLSYVYTPIQREPRFEYIKDWEVNLAKQPMYRVEAWIDA